MTSFEWCLQEEEKWLCHVVDMRMPDDDRAGHRVYMGPARMPWSHVDWKRHHTPRIGTHIHSKAIDQS